MVAAISVTAIWATGAGSPLVAVGVALLSWDPVVTAFSGDINALLVPIPCGDWLAHRLTAEVATREAAAIVPHWRPGEAHWALMPRRGAMAPPHGMGSALGRGAVVRLRSEPSHANTGIAIAGNSCTE